MGDAPAAGGDGRIGDAPAAQAHGERKAAGALRPRATPTATSRCGIDATGGGTRSFVAAGQADSSDGRVVLARKLLGARIDVRSTPILPSAGGDPQE